MSETQTPVLPCSIGTKSHEASHKFGWCAEAQAERIELERRGFYQETYRALDARFKDWNWGVWNDRWTVMQGLPCDLCASTEPSIQSGQHNLCFECLTEFPKTSWHPTGAVVPKLRDLLSHAVRCDKH